MIPRLTCGSHFSEAIPEEEEVLQSLRDAACDRSKSLSTRFRAVLAWGTCAELVGNTSQLEAHIEAVGLLEVFTTRTPSLQEQYVSLANNQIFGAAQGVVANAAALAAANGRVELAIQLLEEGRGVILQKLGKLRADIDSVTVVLPVLAAKYITLSSSLEQEALTGDTWSLLGREETSQAITSR